MTLDPEFKKQTIQLINQTLELYKSAGASPRIGQVWNVDNIGDFLCGFFCWRDGRFCIKCIPNIS